MIALQSGMQKPPFFNPFSAFRTLVRMRVVAATIQQIDNGFQSQVQDSVPLYSNVAPDFCKNTSMILIYTFPTIKNGAQ